MEDALIISPLLNDFQEERQEDNCTGERPCYHCIMPLVKLVKLVDKNEHVYHSLCRTVYTAIC